MIERSSALRCDRSGIADPALALLLAFDCSIPGAEGAGGRLGPVPLLLLMLPPPGTELPDHKRVARAPNTPKRELSGAFCCCIARCYCLSGAGFLRLDVSSLECFDDPLSKDCTFLIKKKLRGSVQNIH